MGGAVLRRPAGGVGSPGPWHLAPGPRAPLTSHPSFCPEPAALGRNRAHAGGVPPAARPANCGWLCGSPLEQSGGEKDEGVPAVWAVHRVLENPDSCRQFKSQKDASFEVA